MFLAVFDLQRETHEHRQTKAQKYQRQERTHRNISLNQKQTLNSTEKERHNDIYQ